VEYLEYVEPGDVIVIANGGRIDCSSWGGQRSLGARQKGAVAAVLHGAYRDVDELRAAGFPVYGVGRTVAGSRHGGIPVAVDVPVTITGCTVNPGDIVVGDASGVIVVPQHAAEDVLREAEAVAGREHSTATALADGADFLAYRASLRGVS
jgi:4-hydroxy-4-methyl-2-oxoglutarate aldolase